LPPACVRGKGRKQLLEGGGGEGGRGGKEISRNLYFFPLHPDQQQNRCFSLCDFWLWLGLREESIDENEQNKREKERDLVKIRGMDTYRGRERERLITSLSNRRGG